MTDTDKLLSICHRLVDPAAQPAAVHQGHNNTIALRATTTSGQVIVKMHRGLDRHQQELHAYQTWTPQLGDRVPHLIAHCDDPPAIVITALPGTTLPSTRLSPCHESIAYRQAGELLRQLHNAGPPRDEPDMTTWLAERGEYWLAQARAIISGKRQAEIRAHLAALTDLPPIPAVPCHLDYTPRNLIAQPSGDVAVIDFEHSRYDLAARDLVRLATRVWPARPDLKEAFLSGYGPLNEADHHVIEHCTPLDALTATVRMAQL